MNALSTFALPALLWAMTSGASPVSTSFDDPSWSNVPPIVVTGGNVGDDYEVDCNNYNLLGVLVTSVQLDGSASYDPDGTPVTFYWHNECAYGYFDDPYSPAPVYHVDMTGACERQCVVALRVTSGGQTAVQGFTVTVRDVTPPAIAIPPDYLGIWGDEIDAARTGAPSFSDNCDPTPYLSYFDVELPVTGPGQPELSLLRTWTVVDCMGYQAAGVQTIQLLAPTGDPGYRANLDFDPLECPNVFPMSLTGSVDVTLLGSSSFRVENVMPATLRLWVREAPGIWIQPNAIVLQDAGSIATKEFGGCNSLVADGMRDLTLRFDRLNLASQFDLGRFSGQTIEVMVTGNMRKSLKLFGVRDMILVK